MVEWFLAQKMIKSLVQRVFIDPAKAAVYQQKLPDVLFFQLGVNRIVAMNP